MPSYEVISPGFSGGKLYHPTGKRRKLTVDKPFKKTPKWLKPIKAETAAEKKARLAEEEALAKKIEEDAKKVEGASFIDGNVESL